MWYAMSLENRRFSTLIDIWYMIIFGVIGYIFKKLDYPLAPLVLALVLGDFAESALRQSLIMSQGSLLIFFRRPIAAAISALAIFFLLLPALSLWRRKRQQKRELARAPGLATMTGSTNQPSSTEAR